MAEFGLKLCLQYIVYAYMRNILGYCCNWLLKFSLEKLNWIIQLSLKKLINQIP